MTPHITTHLWFFSRLAPALTRRALLLSLWKLHWPIRVIWFNLGAERGSSGVCVRAHVHFFIVACMAVVMDDEKELINTKSLSVWLHPNFPPHVCTVSQQPQTEKQSGGGWGVTTRCIGKFKGVNKWSCTVGCSWHMRINLWRCAAHECRRKLKWQRQ